MMFSCFFQSVDGLVTVNGFLVHFSTSKMVILNANSTILGPGRLSELSFSVWMWFQPGHAGHQGCSGQFGELLGRSETIGVGFVPGWAGGDIIAVSYTHLTLPTILRV